jgi:transposase InsO family protein
MPWRAVDVMELREDFAVKVVRHGVDMAEACRQFGISRPTGYKWLRRYEADGRAGLIDRSRAPRRIPHKTAKDIEGHVVWMRERYPTWGPKKIRALLLRQAPDVDWPAPSTIGEILERRGLIAPKQMRRRVVPSSQPLRHAVAPNDVWSIDFKGQFMLRNGVLCYPLTVTDNASRMLLECNALPSTRTDLVKPRMIKLFEQFGLPTAIRSDNGAPFASSGVLGLSELSAWWLSLGISHERIEVGHPEQNGRHERMHLTLKQETARPGADDMASQQARFAQFIERFNHIRPHEALGQRPPASVYSASTRRYPQDVRPPDYSACDLVRKIHKSGELRWRKVPVYVGMALGEHTVGLTEMEPDVWMVTFAGHDLGLFEPGDSQLSSISRGRWASQGKDTECEMAEAPE